MVNWLAKYLVHPMVEALLYVLRFGVSCHSCDYGLLIDARSLFSAELSPDELCAFESVHKRHVAVHQD